MTPRLDVAEARDIAVLRGVDTEAALAHLCRSLVTGSVFDAYRALVIDLHGCSELASSTAEELERASAACQQRHQWLGIARDEDVGDIVAQARRWLRLVDRERAVGVASRFLRMNVGLAAGVASAAGDVVAHVLRPLRDEGPSDKGHTAP